MVAREASGDKERVADVVARTAEPLQEEDLRRHLEGKLPRYMQPGAIAQLEKLPCWRAASRTGAGCRSQNEGRGQVKMATSRRGC